MFPLALGSLSCEPPSAAKCSRGPVSAPRVPRVLGGLLPLIIGDSQAGPCRTEVVKPAVIWRIAPGKRKGGRRGGHMRLPAFGSHLSLPQGSLNGNTNSEHLSPSRRPSKRSPPGEFASSEPSPSRTSGPCLRCEAIYAREEASSGLCPGGKKYHPRGRVSGDGEKIESHAGSRTLQEGLSSPHRKLLMGTTHGCIFVINY
ncbi:hypothetical protein BJY52DRAFT_1230441 [Lactarius psammicola]|nr:hypothetical protein BJY52DRAFT_1230441 [Lactarius psammicola]